jgi:hypothetical protein
MKKIDLGQMITILANVGVIAGIAFLAIELQQNNQLLSAQARTERAAVRISYVDNLTNNQALLSAMVKDRNQDPLSALEKVMLDEWYIGTFSRWQYVHGELRQGLIEEADLPVRDWAAYFSQNPAMAETWRRTGHLSFRPDFVQFMEENVVNR